MSEEEIQAIYEKDLKAFHRDMAYMNHVVPLDNIEEFDPDSLSPRQKKIVMEMTCEDPEFETTFSWLDEITLQPLASSIHKLSVDIETKKMILGCLIKRIEVFRDYQINVGFNIDLDQFLHGLDYSA